MVVDVVLLVVVVVVVDVPPISRYKQSVYISWLTLPGDVWSILNENVLLPSR